jgi:hypothetical protein
MQDSRKLIQQPCWTAPLQKQRLSRRLLKTPHSLGMELLTSQSSRRARKRLSPQPSREMSQGCKRAGTIWGNQSSSSSGSGSSSAHSSSRPQSYSCFWGMCQQTLHIAGMLLQPVKSWCSTQCRHWCLPVTPDILKFIPVGHA